MRDATIKILVGELVKRNVFLLSYTLFSFLPNNLIFFLKYFFGADFLNTWSYLNYIIISIISFNACYSFLIIVSDPYMKKFFKQYYNFFRFFRSNNKTNNISKLSDLIELVKDDGHDLTKNFLINKTFDYNYANIYLKTDQKEMNYLSSNKSMVNDFENVNAFSFKKIDSNNSLRRSFNIINHNKDDRSETNLSIVPKNENNNLQYKITIQNSEFNLIRQNSNNSVKEKYNNLISNSKVSTFLLNSHTAENSNNKEKDDVSDKSNNRIIDNSIDIASMNSCESAEMLTIKRSTYNKNKLGIFNFFFKLKNFSNSLK